MISTLHTAEEIETTSRQMGVAKKKPKCIIDYNTHMHGVDTADQYVLLPMHSLNSQVAQESIFLSSPVLPFHQLCYLFKE